MTPAIPFSYFPAYVSPERAKGLLDMLWRELDWSQYQVRLFGKQIPQPRLTAWCCDPGVVYSYSGIRLTHVPWHPDLETLRREIGTGLGHEFNSVLANAYRDGSDAMGWHADDEPELGPDPVIASLSLGAKRHMLVRPKKGGKSIRMELENGSLLVMESGAQLDWMHSIPRTTRPSGLRINLTFRSVIA